MIRLDASDLINGIPIEAKENEKFVADIVEKGAYDVLRDLKKNPPEGSPRLSGDFAKDWSISKAGATFIMDNTMPYAARLVFDGWSKKVPVDWVPRIVRKHFPD